GEHTIVLSTHILPEVEHTCDRIIMISRGRIRAAGMLDEVRRSAVHGGRYIIETDSPRGEQVLREMLGVRDLQCNNVDSRWRRLTLTPAHDAGDMRERIAAALLKTGGMTREIRQEAPSLEHLFVQMTAEAELTNTDVDSAVTEVRS